ncbi:MAG: WXG100 family type VII secretion target [Acutalibacteraceae bacterium]|nr:WXG100 family type VII secretion target [Acutalibacteraceae bacterium]
MSENVIDIEKMRTSGSRLEKTTDELKDLRSDLYKLICEIDDTWDGDASRSYINRLNGYIDKLDHLADVLPLLADYFSSSADRFEEIDNDLKKKVPTVAERIENCGDRHEVREDIRKRDLHSI